MGDRTVENCVLAATKAVEDQIDAEIEKLDKMEDEDLQALERSRAAALRQQIRRKEELLANGHGVYSEVANDKEMFEVSKKSPKFIVHFYRNSTMRCGIVDKHLQALAPKHIETKFCKIRVDKSPFLVERLRITVLPTIALFHDGKAIDYIVGFDDLGGVDDFSTEMMEWRIARKNMIHYSGDLSVPPGKRQKKTNPFLKSKPKTIRGGNDGSDTDSD